MDPMGLIDSIYKEEYYTLVCTKMKAMGLAVCCCCSNRFADNLTELSVKFNKSVV